MSKFTSAFPVAPGDAFASGPNQKAHLPQKLTLTYTYTFDSKDRVSTVRQDYSDGDVVITTYTNFD